MDKITDPKLIKDVHHKYLDILGMVWITVLVTTLLTAAKTFDLGPFSFSVGVIFYPVTYIFADIFTEVYGYKKTRRIVWTGLVCLLIGSVMSYLYSIVPSSPSYTDNAAFNTIFHNSPVFALVSVATFFIGEFSNSYVLAKMKIVTKGKHLWLRLLASTALGQTLDNGLAYLGAFLFAGYFSWHQLPNLIFSTVAFCTAWEFLATPVTYKIASFLKKAEGLDIYDRGTNFNPFSFSQ
jgi:uncharacterized integral membrane protein (TIGR00697 family)